MKINVTWSRESPNPSGRFKIKFSKRRIRREDIITLSRGIREGFTRKALMEEKILEGDNCTSHRDTRQRGKICTLVCRPHLGMGNLTTGLQTMSPLFASVYSSLCQRVCNALF